MPTTEMIVMVSIIAALALSFIQILRLVNAGLLHKTVRKLVERDPEHAQALISKLGEPPARSGDDRLAIILLAIGLAMAAGTVIAIDDPGLVRFGIAASLFPLSVGAALWLRIYLERRRRASGK